MGTKQTPSIQLNADFLENEIILIKEVAEPRRQLPLLDISFSKKSAFCMGPITDMQTYWNCWKDWNSAHSNKVCTFVSPAYLGAHFF